MSELACSVIVPSYNRRATLEMVLQGLAQQTLPASLFEVIVVLDGSTDDSAVMLSEWQDTGRLAHLRWHLQPNSGQAKARNTGVELAQAPVVVFFDDDVVPEPDALEVHVRRHAHGESIAVLGDCRIVREQHDSLYHLGVWSWWEDMYHQRALPGRQPGYRDFCAGNVSLRREDFLRVGGFDPEFRGYGGEDFELGYRLLRAGVQFVADRAAQARHYHRTTVAGVLRATRQEAHGDVVLGRKHPELRPGLRLMHLPHGRYGLLAQLALRAPWVGDQLMRTIQAMLPLYQRTQMRRRWMERFNHVRGYAYWRGVRDVFGSWRALADYQMDKSPLPHYTLDISDGLPQELPAMWVDGPSQVLVTARGQTLGTITLPQAFDTPVHEHLKQALIGQLWPQLWVLLAQHGLNQAPPVAVQPLEVLASREYGALEAAT